MIKAGQRPLIYKLRLGNHIAWYIVKRAVRATARQDHRCGKENGFQKSYLCLELIS